MMAKLSMLERICDLALPACHFCGKPVLFLENKKGALVANYFEHQADVSRFSGGRAVCEACLNVNSVARCCKTGELFNAGLDCSTKMSYRQMRANLWPHHHSASLSGSLSPEGEAAIAREHAEMMGRLASWAGGTRNEYLRGFRIVRDIGLIREDRECPDVATVEERLRQQTAQIGGNGFVKFFWNRHHEGTPETYIRGYGHRGNPYFGTRYRHSNYFTGHAVAVCAVPVGNGNRGSS